MQFASSTQATQELHDTIRQFNEVATKQTTTIIRLTWVIAFMTFVMLLEVAYQIWKGTG